MVESTIEAGKYQFTTKVETDPNSYYIQLVLKNSDGDIRRISGNVSTRFELTKSYTHRLIRIIIKKGVTLDINGCMILEKLV